jgi:hypothetical protein
VETWVYLCTQIYQVNIGENKMNILMLFIIIWGIIIGVGSTSIIVFMLFGTVGFKVYRKVKYGISLYD